MSTYFDLYECDFWDIKEALDWKINKFLENGNIIEYGLVVDGLKKDLSHVATTSSNTKSRKKANILLSNWKKTSASLKDHYKGKATSSEEGSNVKSTNETSTSITASNNSFVSFGRVRNVYNINVRDNSEKTIRHTSQQEIPKHSSSSSSNINNEEQDTSVTIDDNNNQTTIEKLDIPVPSENNRYIVNNVDVSQGFYNFQIFTKNRVLSGQLLQLERHLQHIMSLSSILLLKPDRYHGDLKTFVNEITLNEAVKNVNEQLGINSHQFDHSLLFELNTIIKDTKIGNINRIIGSSKVMNLAIQEDHITQKLLLSIRNLLEVLPMKNMDEEIKEYELISRYIQPSLGPLFDDLPNNIMFRWTSTNNSESKASMSISKKRPDSCINKQDGILFGETFGFGEVKCKSMALNHHNTQKDLLRLAHFSKNSIDTHSLTSVLSFHVVGDHVTFYLIQLKADGLYIMIEIGHIKIPLSIYEIPYYITHFDELLDIMYIYYEHVLQQSIENNYINQKRKTISTPEYNVIVDKTVDKKRRCITSHHDH